MFKIIIFYLLRIKFKNMKFIMVRLFCYKACVKWIGTNSSALRALKNPNASSHTNQQRYTIRLQTIHKFFKIFHMF